MITVYGRTLIFRAPSLSTPPVIGRLNGHDAVETEFVLAPESRQHA